MQGSNWGECGERAFVSAEVCALNSPNSLSPSLSLYPASYPQFGFVNMKFARGKLHSRVPGASVKPLKRVSVAETPVIEGV